MAKLNYATEYLQTLEQMFPYVLYFGDLFATPNNGRFRWVNSRVIEVPTISTTGRTKLQKENDELKAAIQAQATMGAVATTSEDSDKKITKLQKENDKLKVAVQAQSATGNADPAETEKKTAAKGSKKTE